VGVVYSLLQRKKRGALIFASLDVVEICKLSDSAIKGFQNQGNLFCSKLEAKIVASVFQNVYEKKS